MIENLKKRINKNYYQNLLEYSKKLNNEKHIELIKNKIEDILIITNELTFCDNYIYKKSWKKLNIIHKVLKIKEYINTNFQVSNQIRDSIINTLEELITKKHIDENNILYDLNNMKIISITILEYSNGAFKININ